MQRTLFLTSFTRYLPAVQNSNLLGARDATAGAMVRYGIATLDTFRTMGETDRKYLFEYLRKTRTAYFSSISLPPQAGAAYSAERPKVSGENMRRAELDIPRELSRYKPSLCPLSSFFVGPGNGKLGKEGNRYPPHGH